MTTLDPEATDLLWQLVEAARAVPRSQRGDFMALRFMGGNTLQHPGLPGGGIEGYDESDLRDLIESGFVRVTHYGRSEETFELRKAAFDAYDRAHRNLEAPIDGQQRLVMDRVASPAFGTTYREAFSKWREAESLLWAEESVRNLTMIGHLCREAMQLFVTRLIEIHAVADVEPDVAKTVNRLHSVIDARKSAVSSRKAAFIGALVEYWKAVNGIVQRQEHGEQKGGDELTWDDGRRAILYTAMVMAECDRVLS